LRVLAATRQTPDNPPTASYLTTVWQSCREDRMDAATRSLMRRTPAHPTSPEATTNANGASLSSRSTKHSNMACQGYTMILQGPITQPVGRMGSRSSRGGRREKTIQTCCCCDPGVPETILPSPHCRTKIPSPTPLTTFPHGHFPSPTETSLKSQESTVRKITLTPKNVLTLLASQTRPDTCGRKDTNH